MGTNIGTKSYIHSVFPSPSPHLFLPVLIKVFLMQKIQGIEKNSENHINKFSK